MFIRSAANAEKQRSREHDMDLSLILHELAIGRGVKPEALKNCFPSLYSAKEKPKYSEDRIAKDRQTFIKMFS